MHTEEKVLHIVWHTGMDLHCSAVALIRWQKTVDMVRKKLKPVCPSSGLGFDSIIFKYIEMTLALNKDL